MKFKVGDNVKVVKSVRCLSELVGFNGGITETKKDFSGKNVYSVMGEVRYADNSIDYEHHSFIEEELQLITWKERHIFNKYSSIHY